MKHLLTHLIHYDHPTSHQSSYPPLSPLPRQSRDQEGSAHHPPRGTPALGLHPLRAYLHQSGDKHSPYPVKVIMEGIGRYNLGYSARETTRYLNRRFRIAVPEKTFRLWYTAHKPICTYHAIRAAIKRRFEPAGLIEKHYL